MSVIQILFALPKFGAEMKVLIACEFSGIVRDAFIKCGHDAWSCDLLPTERAGPHIQDDVLAHLNESWDIMIAHPPCTYLCNSGVRWLFGGRGFEVDQNRWSMMLGARDFFKRLLNAPIAKIAIENPIMHSHAQIVKPTQIIQPYMFGHGETKATCLWLKNVPPLQPTEIVTGRNQRVFRASPSPDRWKERSRTLEGIASAMANQWS